MAMALQIATFAHQWWYASSKPAQTSQNPLRMGILSTAMINSAAVIRPAQTHGDVLITAVASRDLAQAKQYAKKYGIPSAYGSYGELLQQPDIDFVYISLPNGLHAEWAMKALEAGKHVLLEKPFADNEIEAERVVALAERTGLVLMEAFHWQCHPAAHAFRDIVNRPKHGRILRTYARMTSPVGSIPESDIRWRFDLGGGSLMDMTYVVSATRFILDAGAASSVAAAKARPFPKDPRVDEAIEATLVFRHGSAEGKEGEYDVTSEIYSDMKRANVGFVIPRVWELPSIEVETANAKIYFYNFMMPHLYHYIAVTDKETGETTYHKAYKRSSSTGEHGDASWSTYRWQLELFVDRLRGREPAHWVTNKSSVDQMKTIDMVYEKAGLPLRPTTSYGA
ncbi:NAD binding Rossmann fold oxidoreductase [Punctularia strigosozonata HHB-11173 SS5]|uniref:NAD binding Rossmann fold oxidoreductase n=1 Tax=Punctularia strigosozonata (strain HHB-11173) TaxID=741275 RepID=UPI0004417165|nr:NAD binding Rossmann fold oxidoreductase [Punctularia strigosozonata HHB-11173 SS5]EIN05782.1 NAD binding Rossmann fold oxidoreductase [Punctularia strigosozonata HHB-11173 SS5]